MDRRRIISIVDAARGEGRSLLLEHEGYAILDAAGIAVPRHVYLERGQAVDATTLAPLAPGEIVVKVVSEQILHKSDVGGVRRLPADLDRLRPAIDAMLAGVHRAAPEAELRGVLLVEAVQFATDQPGAEYLLSLRRDAAFGPALMFGLGGLLTEWYGELSAGESHLLFSAHDFDADAAVRAIGRTTLGKLALRPSRLHREAPIEAKALACTLAGLAELAALKDERGRPVLDELELNPMVGSNGRLVALDALGRLHAGEVERRPARPIATIGNLLRPRSAAVYGASASGVNAGRIILQNLKNSDGLDYGHLYAIHPKASAICGIPCHASAAALPECVDLAVVSIPAEAATDAIEELTREQKARSIILIPGGFAESGRDDLSRRIQKTLTESREREDGGPVLVGGNCLGIVSKHQYNTFFLPTYKLPFSDAPGSSLVLISQSGAYLVSMNSNLDGIIFPRASISYGNEMDLCAGDFLEYYLAHEPGISVFAFYIEGFQPTEGERFLRLVRQANAEDKTVVVYKAGKTDVGARAAASHTASVAGDYRVAKSLLSEAGAVVCETLNMFEDYTKALTMLSQRKTEGNRVGVITNAGFEAGAVSDHLWDLELARFPAELTKQLDRILPSIAHTGNPVDCTPMTGTKAFAEAVRTVADSDAVDMLIVSAVPATPVLDVLVPDPTGRHEENIFALRSLPAELSRIYREIEKPMIVCIDSGRLYDPSVLMLERAGVPVYRKIDRASRALSVFSARCRQGAVAG
jgi:acyl-CoA synthetase (NDP forming)